MVSFPVKVFTCTPSSQCGSVTEKVLGTPATLFISKGSYCATDNCNAGSSSPYTITCDAMKLNSSFKISLILIAASMCLSLIGNI